MRPRRKIKSKKTNRKIFKKGAKQLKINKPKTSSRGGYRL